MDTGIKEIKKTLSVKNFNKEDYITERTFAFTEDDVFIPISLFYKKGIL